MLCNRPAEGADASTIADHLDAFSKFSGNKVTELSFLRCLPKNIKLIRFDVIIIHYSLAIGYLRKHYINQETIEKIQAFKGLKAVFIQDEYRSVRSVWETLKTLEIDILFTCVPQNEIEKVYPSKILPNILKINTLTGYVPSKLLAVRRKKIKNRKIDVGYRSRKPPFWLGRLGYEKQEIASSFLKKAIKENLILDISCDETTRIYGKKWINFITSCKTMLGVESGSSVFDFDGKLQKKVEEYVKKNKQISFFEIQKRFLINHENKILLNQISPRCFEAAALGTAMILYEGKYSGILKPWRHFIPLKKDFSNFKLICKTLKNNKKVQQIADRAFFEIAHNKKFSYEQFIKDFDAIIQKEFLYRNKRRCLNPYTKNEYWIDLLFSPGFYFKHLLSYLFQKLILATSLRSQLYHFWENVPIQTRQVIRPLLYIIGR